MKELSSHYLKVFITALSAEFELTQLNKWIMVSLKIIKDTKKYEMKSQKKKVRSFYYYYNCRFLKYSFMIIAVKKLTSWEQFNFVLIGLINEITRIKDCPGLKLTALQIWASYLKENEVAFFSEKEELPKFYAYYRKE